MVLAVDRQICFVAPDYGDDQSSWTMDRYALRLDLAGVFIVAAHSFCRDDVLGEKGRKAMRFRITLQRNHGGWWDTGYWLEVNLPGVESRSNLDGLMISGNPADILLIAALSDESLLPNDGFRFVYRSVNDEKGAVIDGLAKEMIGGLIREHRRREGER